MISNLSAVSIKEIKNDIHSFIEKELNSVEAIKRLPSSTINIIENIAAGAASSVIYHNMMMRNERFLSTAVLDSSIFNLARDYSYNMSRAVSPKLTLIYNKTESKVIKECDKLGTYNDYDIIYFGNTKTIEKGDHIEVSIGIVRTIKDRVSLVDNSLFIELKPNKLKSIDNNQVKLYVNDSEIKITKLVENFTVLNEVVDFSITNTSTKLLICDNTYQYGTLLKETDILEVKYLETDGMLKNLETRKAQVSEDFLVDSISSLGIDPEPVSKIRNLAPLFYTTQRRMVTPKDHVYIAESCPLFKSIGYKKDGGKPLHVKVRITEERKVYIIKIDGRPYTIIRETGDTNLNILDKIKNALKRNSQIISTNEGEYSFILARDSRNETTLEFSEGIEQTIIQVNERPKCCTVYLYYVKYNTEDYPIVLTEQEQLEAADFLERYKFEGVRIILIPATRLQKELKLGVKLRDLQYKKEIENKIKEIVQSYELKLDKLFLYGEFLAKVAQIRVTNIKTKETINPIEYILPEQQTFDVQPSPDQYIKFSDISINFIGE